MSTPESDLEIEDIRDAYAADGEPGDYLKRAIEFDKWLNKERAKVYVTGYVAGQDSDKEKMLAWLDYAINVNYEEYHESGDDYWGGRMSAYRNVRERLRTGDFDFPEGDDD